MVAPMKNAMALIGTFMQISPLVFLGGCILMPTYLDINGPDTFFVNAKELMPYIEKYPDYVQPITRLKIPNPSARCTGECFAN